MATSDSSRTAQFWLGSSPVGSDVWLLLGRLALGGIFVIAGFEKLMNLSGFAASLALKGVPLPALAAAIGAPVEFFGGVAIVLGIAGRYAALLMVAFTVVATLISHRYWQYSDAAVRGAQYIQFSKNIAIIGGFLLLFAHGSGRFALDRLLRRRGR